MLSPLSLFQIQILFSTEYCYRRLSHDITFVDHIQPIETCALRNFFKPIESVPKTSAFFDPCTPKKLEEEALIIKEDWSTRDPADIYVAMVQC